MNKSDPKLSVIISLKVLPARKYLIDRMAFCLLDTELPENVELLIVSDGSDPGCFSELVAKSGGRFRIVETKAGPEDEFSLARARNFGANEAFGDFLIFLDVDLATYPGFFKSIQNEILLLDMARQVTEFLMVPVIYLSPEGYEIFNKLAPGLRHGYFINALQRGDGALVEKYSSGTSVVVIERGYYLARGGQDESFQGWGYEDYEFANRLIRRNGRFEMPADWFADAGNFMTINRYSGWKSIYRLYGDWSAGKGIYLFHIPHDIDETFHKEKSQNWHLLKERMAADVAYNSEPSPIPDRKAGRTLALEPDGLFVSREIAPFLGEVTYRSLNSFADIAAVETFLAEHSISRIILSHSHRWDKKTEFLSMALEKGVEVVTFGKGCLPGSFFFDWNNWMNTGLGGLPNSVWDKPLSPDLLSRTGNYIASLMKTNHTKTLPDSPENRAARVILVPVDEFCPKSSGYEENISVLVRYIHDLPDGWEAIIYDPAQCLEGRYPNLNRVSGSNSEVLLGQCDAVLVWESDLAIPALLRGKSVVCCGQPWYAQTGLVSQITSADEFKQKISALHAPDRNRLMRLIAWLRWEFYSFADEPLTGTSEEIRFNEIRGWGAGERLFKLPHKPVTWNSPLFARYSGDRAQVAPIRLKGRIASKTRLERIRENPRAFLKNTKILPLRPFHHLFK